MKLALTTYDSIVCAVTQISIGSNAISFSERLETAARLFAAAINEDAKSIQWREVEHSEWCKGKIVLYCCVSRKWQPKPDTIILDQIKSDYANSCDDYIRGAGSFTDTRKYPPINPHKLYHSK